MAGNWQTPQNEKSFSAIIDQVILDTGQSASLLSAISYANATIKECHALGLCPKDMQEEQITATADPHIYDTLPNYRKLRTVYYPDVDEWPEYCPPGRKMKDKLTWNSFYYYAISNSFVFKGPAIGTSIKLAAYYWPQPFEYYTRLGATNTANLAGSGYLIRPAYFDNYTGIWMYYDAVTNAYVTTLGDIVAEELARNNSANWSCLLWSQMILEGTKAKMYLLKNDPRGSGTYSIFTNMKDTFKINEGFETENF